MQIKHLIKWDFFPPNAFFIRTHHTIVQVGWLRLADQHDIWKATGQSCVSTCFRVRQSTTVRLHNWRSNMGLDCVADSTLTIDLHQCGRQFPRLFTYLSYFPLIILFNYFILINLALKTIWRVAAMLATGDRWYSSCDSEGEMKWEAVELVFTFSCRLL